MNAVLMLEILQIVCAIALVLLVLIQNSEGGLSGTFGGSISAYRSKRGIERSIQILTIFFSIVFVINSLMLVRVI